MSELINVNISELGNTVTGKTPSSNCPEDFGNEYMFITPSDNFDVKTIKSTSRYLSNNGYNKLINKAIPANNVLVTCIGSAMGKVAKNKFPCITNQQINSIVVGNDYDSDYIYYLLCNNYKLLRNAATGSTSLPLLNKTDFDALKIKIHSDKDYCKKITSVLSSIDSFIEINNTINVELESIAKLIYDYWFVQYDFPDENGKPYKSSGGKMVYNEELKREIPEGWEVSEISGLIEMGKDQLTPSENPEKEFKHLSIPVFDECGGYNLEKGKDIGSSKFIVKKFDILVSKLNPWFNRVYYAPNKDDIICTTEMVVWRHNNLFSKNFFYYLARSDRFIKFCTQCATGTSNSHKRVNPSQMMGYKIAYNSDLIEKFGAIVDPWIKRSNLNTDEIRKLVELRDWLLPMLMNGQVTVT